MDKNLLILKLDPETERFLLKLNGHKAYWRNKIWGAFFTLNLDIRQMIEHGLEEFIQPFHLTRMDKLFPNLFSNLKRRTDESKMYFGCTGTTFFRFITVRWEGDVTIVWRISRGVVICPIGSYVGMTGPIQEFMTFFIWNLVRRPITVVATRTNFVSCPCIFSRHFNSNVLTPCERPAVVFTLTQENLTSIVSREIRFILWIIIINIKNYE